MLKKLFLPILISALLGSLAACNSSKSEDDEVTFVQSASVAVTAFSLQNNSKILDSLSNVFFSIDLVNAKIFNADSLPYGTKVSKLVPSITVPSTASKAELKFYSTETSRDSVVDYRTSSTDSIDFTHPVILTVVSQNGAVTRDYQIRVNVHKMRADSLAWYKIESAPLPSSFSKVKAQSTAYLGGTYYCLTSGTHRDPAPSQSDGTSYCLATTDDPAEPKWQTKEITLPFDAAVSTLRATDDALYMLDTAGELYTSTDFSQWQSTSQTWHYIYGAYGNDILGCDATTENICAYPSGSKWAMPTGFPVEGTSVPSVYTLPMAYSPQLVMLGGVDSKGTLLDGAWAFDGNEWGNVTTKPLPEPLRDITMVAYDLVEVPSSTWAPYDYPVLLAFGGVTERQAINRTVYYSRDWGMTWRKAPDLVQLPDEMPTFYGASAFVHSTTMHVSRAGGWLEVPTRNLPPQYQWPVEPQSRAVKPISQWECPAIYLFGGKDYDGNTLHHVWRGVILQYTFVPVQ